MASFGAGWGTTVISDCGCLNGYRIALELIVLGLSLYGVREGKSWINLFSGPWLLSQQSFPPVNARYYVSSLEVLIITYTLGVKCCFLKRLVPSPPPPPPPPSRLLSSGEENPNYRSHPGWEMENNALIWLQLQGEEWDWGCDSPSAALLCWPNSTWRQEQGWAGLGCGWGSAERSFEPSQPSLHTPAASAGKQVLQARQARKTPRYFCLCGKGSKTAIKVTIKPSPNQRGPWTTKQFSFVSVFLCGFCNTQKWQEPFTLLL